MFELDDLTYLAAPYTSPDPQISLARQHACAQVTTNLMSRGQAVFSPLTYEIPLLQNGLTIAPEDWYTFDLNILRKCHSLTVLTLPGWEQSKGVNLEIQEARRLGLPVYYIDLDLNSQSSPPKRDDAKYPPELQENQDDPARQPRS